MSVREEEEEEEEEELWASSDWLTVYYPRGGGGGGGRAFVTGGLDLVITQNACVHRATDDGSGRPGN